MNKSTFLCFDTPSTCPNFLYIFEICFGFEIFRILLDKILPQKRVKRISTKWASYKNTARKAYREKHCDTLPTCYVRGREKCPSIVRSL